MVPERIARTRGGGGADIPSKRPSRVRLITALLAFVAAALVVLLSLDLRSPGLSFISGGFGAFALVVLGATLVLAKPGWIGVAVALLGAGFLGHLAVLGEPGGEGLGLASVALLFVGELSQWSIEVRVAGRDEWGVHRSRAVSVALLGLLAVGIVLLARLAASVHVDGGIVMTAIATITSVVLLGLISGVALRRAAGDGGNGRS